MIILTGAGGFVAGELAARAGSGDNMLLVSRSPGKLAAENRGLQSCNYEELSQMDLTGAVVVHLAARNNNEPGDLAKFREANVDFLLQIAAMAKSNGAQGFVNLSSTHALAPKPGDKYGLSKLEGAKKLRALWPEGAVNLYIPAVYGDTFRGRLALLNRFPAALRPAALSILRHVKPLISIETLQNRLQELAEASPEPADTFASEQYAADPVRQNGAYAFVKRCMDLVAGILVVSAGLPIMALIAIAIRLDSSGPAIFAQERVGRNGRKFTCYKFRTMSVGTAVDATHKVSASSVTRVGSVLRRTKLDELPQAVNLILNDMSLVGPRPCLPSQHELVELRLSRGVLDTKPGITGLSQINDIDMSDPALLAMWDNRWAVLRTTFSDIVIALRTGFGTGSGDRVENSKEPVGKG
ncbi:sugar transferase [Altererythrobacter sp.]|nr:sugar transferase [Altererythrobacter sp.]